MKKLVTWISRVGKQFQSTISLDKRSIGRLLSVTCSRISARFSHLRLWQAVNQSITTLQQFTQPFWAKFRLNKKPAPTKSGLIETFNQRYLKLPPPFSAFLKPLIIVVSLVSAYAILGFYALPVLLKTKLPDLIQEHTGRKAFVGNIEFNPFELASSLHNFKILEKNGKPFASFEHFNFDFNGVQSIKTMTVVIDEVSLKKPTVHLAKLKDGKFNFADMTTRKKTEPKKKPDDKLLPLTVSKLSIKEGKLIWDDKHFGKSVSEEFSAINMNLTDLSTTAKTKAKLDFGLAIKSGGKLDWKTNLGINPLFSEGSIKFDKVQLQTALALALSDTANFDIGGHELLNLDYKVTTDKKDLKIAIKKIKLELKDFQFTDKSAEKNYLKTPSFIMETDANITLANNKLDVVINKAKLDSKDLQFANQIPKPLSVTIPKLSHETDLKISQIKDELRISSHKAKLNLGNVQVIGLNQDKIEVKIPDFALAVGYQLGLMPVKDKKDKQLDVLVNKGTLDLYGLVLSEKGAPKPIIVVPTFGLTGVDVNLNKQEVNIASVNSKDATFEAWLDKDGVINYQALLPPPTPKPVKPKNPIATARVVNYQEDTPTEDNDPSAIVNKAKKNWLIKINNIAFDNFGLKFEDKSINKPVIIKANPINLKLSSFSTQPDAKLPFQLDLGINKTGSIQLHGDAVLAPLVAKIAVAIKNIDLETFQPYVDKFARLDILDGKFNTGGDLILQQVPEKPLAIKFTGNASIADLLTRDQIVNKDFVKWDNLTFKDLYVDLLANQFTAKLLLIEKPYAKVTIRKDKTVNFSDILIADKSEKNTKSKTAKTVKSPHRKTSSSEAPLFKLDKIKIVDGSSDFADLSLILPFAAQIKSLDGGANGISSEQKSTIHVDLKGNAYDLAPVDINGEISPYLGNFNVNLKFDGMPMPLVTPYMVQFAGYKIEKGKLTMGLQYQVEKGQLKAANNIVIDQLELGEKVDNPNAVSLPLELAITLLKDSDGKIKLDVPLTGSLEDPKFDMGGIIIDALVNVLTKIVTSPFNAIASLVGSEENLSVVAFTPGKDNLDAKETKKLDDVAKALKEKTVLNLEIKGAAFIEQDWPILREEALLDQLKKTKATELSKEEGKRIRAEYVELTPDDYNDLLADAFIKQFPAEGEKNLFGQPKLKNSEDDFYKVAKLKLSKILKPEPERLKDLANDRAKIIAKYMVEKGGIPNERVFILDSAVDPKRDGKDIVSALSLKTN